MSFTPLSDGYHVARKNHGCEWCGLTIPPGERYFRYSGICDGEFQDSCMHTECQAAMDRYFVDMRCGDDCLLPCYGPRGLTPDEWEDMRMEAAAKENAGA